MVYLTLSAQYESFLPSVYHPAGGADGGAGSAGVGFARGISDDVYVQIGLVMLIGLSAKNSILIVEFAEQIRSRTSRSLWLRSWLHSSAAADPDDQLRVHPGGDAALLCDRGRRVGRHSVGTAVVGGMLLSTILNLFFIPVLYVLLSLVWRFSAASRPVQ